MSRCGIGNDTHVVAYSTANHWWATRLWWMLRVFGHDRSLPFLYRNANKRGVVIDLAVHDIDIIRHLTDSEIVEVQPQLARTKAERLESEAKTNADKMEVQLEEPLILLFENVLAPSPTRHHELAVHTIRTGAYAPLFWGLAIQLYDRLLRPALVTVAKAPKKSAKNASRKTGTAKAAHKSGKRAAPAKKTTAPKSGKKVVLAQKPR